MSTTSTGDAAGSAPHTVYLDLPANVAYLGVLRACIQELLAGIEVSDHEGVDYAVRLAASELMTNIVQHGYAGRGGRIRFALTLAPGGSQFVIETQDQSGCAFDPACVPEPSIEALDGRGLYLIRQLVDQVTYSDGHGQAWESRESGPFEPAEAGEPLPSGAWWRLVKALPALDGEEGCA